MKRIFLTFALMAVVTLGVGLADAGPVPLLNLQQQISEPLAVAAEAVGEMSVESFSPESDARFMSLTQAECNDYCYYQGIACMEGCNGNTQCQSQCAVQELQCNCNCGAIPFCP